MIATHGCVRRSRRPLLGTALAVAGLLTTSQAARADMMSPPSMNAPMPMATASMPTGPDMGMGMGMGMGSQDPWQVIRMLEREIRRLAPDGWNPGTGSGATSTMMPNAGAMASVADWSKDHPCGCTPPPPPPTCSGTSMAGTPDATATGSPAPAASALSQPTPAPEPSTIVSGLAMLGLVAWARRARG